MPSSTRGGASCSAPPPTWSRSSSPRAATSACPPCSTSSTSSISSCSTICPTSARTRSKPAPCSSSSPTATNATRSPLPPTSHFRSEEHTSELQSLMRISYAVFCLKKTNNQSQKTDLLTT